MEENKEVTNKENICYEINDYEDGTTQTLSFKPEIYQKIQEEKEELSVKKIFKTKWFERNKEIRYIAQKHENVIDITTINGKTKINLISNEMIKRELSKLSTKEAKKYRNIYFGGIEFTIKAYFQKNIDTPIQIYVLDDRILDNIQDALISVVRGNLIYQKLKFTIQPDFSISLGDKYKDLALTLYYKLEGIRMPPGSKVISIETKMIYALTGNHHIKKQHEMDILVPKLYQDILEPIEHKEYSNITIPEEIYIDYNNTQEIRPIQKLMPKIEHGRLSFRKELVRNNSRIRTLNLINNNNELKIKILLFNDILCTESIAEINTEIKSLVHISKINEQKCENIEPLIYNNSNNSREIIITKRIKLRFKIQDLEYEVIIGVTEYDLIDELILGKDFLDNIKYTITKKGIYIEDQDKVRFIPKICN